MCLICVLPSDCGEAFEGQREKLRPGSPENEQELHRHPDRIQRSQAQPSGGDRLQNRYIAPSIIILPHRQRSLCRDSLLVIPIGLAFFLLPYLNLFEFSTHNMLVLFNILWKLDWTHHLLIQDISV